MRVIQKIMRLIFKILRIIVKLVIYILALFGLFSLFPYNGSDYDAIDYCADDGGVWDEEYHLCRFDCQYGGGNGCSLMPDDELEKLANIYCKKEGKLLYRCKMYKLEWSKRVLRDKMNNLKSERVENYEEIFADKIVVEKKQRKMYLMQDGQIFKEYKISLGSNPIGAKQQENDGKTPEGLYIIERRNPKSKFHLSLKISYPNEADKQWAKEHNVSAGGDIMIHGFPNRIPDFLFNYFHKSDWTQGCIAVTNKEIEEIWELVKDGTPIEIRP